jgi:hypothetical protein
MLLLGVSNGDYYYSAATSLLNTHKARVVADGGTFPDSQYAACIGYIYSMMLAYGTINLSSVLPIIVDPHYFGYKIGTGSGVTASSAVAKLYSLAGASSDMAQATIANQPLLLEWLGSNYWYSPNIVGNYCSSPNAAANRITSDIDIKAN